MKKLLLVGCLVLSSVMFGKGITKEDSETLQKSGDVITYCIKKTMIKGSCTQEEQTQCKESFEKVEDVFLSVNFSELKDEDEKRVYRNTKDLILQKDMILNLIGVED